MFSKKYALFISIFTLAILISLILLIIVTTQTATAQFYGYQNPLTTGSIWSPLQNYGPYQLQNSFQAWQAPVQNFWQAPVQNQYFGQAAWQIPYQSQLPYQLQNPWQPVVQNPWQPVAQNQWQNPWQAQLPWQTPVQNPWLPPWQQAQAQYQDEDVDLDADDDDTTITVEVGETIGIVLESNISTGYSWVLDTDELDPNVVTKVSSQYFPGNIYQLGATGYERWIFEAEAKGDTTIKLDYKRPWEASVQDTFLIEVNVDE